MVPKSETRRRNSRSHQAILDATLKLLGSSGYVDFSIEKVAREAGVGKQTIYRWWASRADLVLEVWEKRLMPPLAPYNGKIDLRIYLERSLYAFGKQLGRTDCRQVAVCVLAEAHRDPELYRRLEEVVYAPRIALIADSFRQAQKDGKFPADADINLVIDSLYGAVWYKVLIRFDTVSRNYVKALVSRVFS
ncbi:MAG: TetR/AcrR family transcriptional regulator [Pseudomonadales bacterium]|nr:TetR/AcrR family transcriptional regulator [Pseudomonadales bacterium]MBO7005026.1 TetR/AcrR family transcriptional regulator [Pseudomonadales bacterium]